MKNSDKTLHIGVLIGNFSTKHPMEVLRGLYAVAEEKNVKLTLISGAQGGIFNYWNADDSKDEGAKFGEYDYQFNALNDYTLIGGFDALIVAYGTISMYLNQVERDTFFDKLEKIPTIIIQEYDGSRNFNYIIADNYSGIKQIMDHLIDEHFCKKIVFLSGPHMNTDSVERLHGYMDSMMMHGFEVTKDMIEYGDYSQTVDYLVERLLDNNPDADAIVCANDEMALSAYRVCKSRGLIIGKDIAITGFDDVDIASGLNPPLTTVRQDGFILGKTAMELAMQGIDNNENKLHIMPVSMVKRESCGCDESELSGEHEVDEMVEEFVNATTNDIDMELATGLAKGCLKIAHSSSDEMIIRNFFMIHLETLRKVRGISGKDEVLEVIKNNLLDKLSSKFRLYNTKNLKFRAFIGYFDRLIDNENEKDTDFDRVRFRYDLKAIMHRYMESLLVQENTEQSELLVRRYWDAPIVIRLLKEQVKDWNTFFRLSLRQVAEHGGRNAYLFLNDGPLKHYKNEPFKCPEKMYMAASYVDGKITVYPELEGQVITQGNGFTELYPDNDQCLYGMFLLFCEAEQYGVLVCELDTESIADMHGVSIQLSSGLSALHANRREESIKHELYETLRILREKNKILSSVSSNDPMTGIYNRRGFTEKALEIIRMNDGKEAFMFFADLDHLKEINDVYGHNEGDFAINTIADCIQDLAGIKGCCARIGGDEFIALVPCNAKEAEVRAESFKNVLKSLNERVNKPYFIESSLGYTGFICDEDVVLDDIVSSADSHMYEAKKSRRSTIRRDSV